MILFIVLSSLLCYIGIGLIFIAPVFVKRTMEYHISHYPSLTEDHELIKYRKEAAGISLLISLVWPFYLVGISMIGLISRNSKLTDLEKIRALENQKRYISQLEREVGIKNER